MPNENGNNNRNPEERLVRRSISVKRYPGKWRESDTPVEIPVLTKKAEEDLVFNEYKELVDKVYGELGELGYNVNVGNNTSNNGTQISGKSKLIRKSISAITNHPKVQNLLPKTWFLNAKWVAEVSRLVNENFQYSISEVSEEIGQMFGD